MLLCWAKRLAPDSMLGIPAAFLLTLFRLVGGGRGGWEGGLLMPAPDMNSSQFQTI